MEGKTGAHNGGGGGGGCSKGQMAEGKKVWKKIKKRENEGKTWKEMHGKK